MVNPSEWGALADASEEARRSEMLRRYRELARLGEEERRAALRGMAEAEYRLPDDKLRTFTKTCLLTWLDLEKEKALAVASSYDYVMTQMPGPVAMKRVAIVQTITRDFTTQQLERLYELIPSVLRGAPRRLTPGIPPSRESPVKEKAKKPFWKFW